MQFGDWGVGLCNSGSGIVGDIIMMLFWLVIVGAALMFFVWLVKELQGGIGSANTAAHVAESPQDILKRRYANGEIDKAEFEEKIKDLGG